MRIFEAILLESYGDVKRFLQNALMDVVGSSELNPTTVQMLKKTSIQIPNELFMIKQTYERVYKIDRTNAREFLPEKNELMSVNGMVKLVKFISKHPAMQGQVEQQTSFWIRALKTSNPLRDFFARIADGLDQVHKFIIDPNREKPQIATIAHHEKYDIYRADNYKGARKFCTTFGATWCVGVNPDDFDAYGPSSDAEMFVVVLKKTKRLIAFHLATHEWTITDHSNDNEISSRKSRNKGIFAIVDDMIDADIYYDTAMKMFREVFKDYGGVNTILRAALAKAYTEANNAQLEPIPNAVVLIHGDELLAQANAVRLYLGTRPTPDQINYAMFIKVEMFKWEVAVSIAGRRYETTIDLQGNVFNGQRVIRDLKLSNSDISQIRDELEHMKDMYASFQQVFELFDMIT